MNKRVKNILAGLITATFCMGASVAMAGVKEVKAALQVKYPSLKIQDLNYITDVKLYEVTILNEKDVKVPIYTNEAIDFLILHTGEIISPSTKQNITTEREIRRTKMVFDGLPFKDAFSIKYGKGTRKVAVFSDPDCPFCQQMEQDWAKDLKADVTVYYFMNPLVSIHPQAGMRAAKIVCDANPAKAWSRYTLAAPGLDQAKQSSFNPDNFLPKNPGTCEKTKIVQAQYDLATTLGFKATPALMFDNGYVVRQRVSAKDMQMILEKRKAQ